MPLTTVTRNYQITIPEEIRRKKGIREGDRIVARLDEKGRIVLEKVSGSIVDDTYGSWRGEKPGKKYVAEIRKGWKKRSEVPYACFRR